MCHSFGNTIIWCGSWSSSNTIFLGRFCKPLFFSMTIIWAEPQSMLWLFSTIMFFWEQCILLLLIMVCTFGILFWYTILPFKLETANSCYKQINFQLPQWDCKYLSNQSMDFQDLRIRICLTGFWVFCSFTQRLLHLNNWRIQRWNMLICYQHHRLVLLKWLPVLKCFLHLLEVGRQLSALSCKA